MPPSKSRLVAESPDGEARLPELARSLRSFGASHDGVAHSAHAAHAAIFVPLLEARTRAAGSDDRGTLAALRGAGLATRIGTLVSQAAQAGQPDAARARARNAAASELLDPLHTELVRLDHLAAAVHAGGTLEWHAWVAQLRRVFTVADGACGALARLLADDATHPSARRWFAPGER